MRPLAGKSSEKIGHHISGNQCVGVLCYLAGGNYWVADYVDFEKVVKMLGV